MAIDPKTAARIARERGLSLSDARALAAMSESEDDARELAALFEPETETDPRHLADRLQRRQGGGL